jgi:hypothetical protein
VDVKSSYIDGVEESNYDNLFVVIANRSIDYFILHLMVILAMFASDS